MLTLFSCYINLRWTNCSKNISNRKFVADQYAINKWLGRKFTADQYAVYKWLGRKFITLHRKVESILLYGALMKKTGFYIIKDAFFDMVNDRCNS